MFNYIGNKHFQQPLIITHDMI